MNNIKQRFIIHCTTDWCGIDNDYPALAKDESDLYDLADNLAVDNLMSYMSLDEIAEENGIIEDNYDDWEDYANDRDNIDITQYCRSNIELFDNTDEEWNNLINFYGGVYEV